MINSYELKNVVEGLYSQCPNKYVAEKTVSGAVTDLMESGKLRIEDIDFNKLASTFICEGRSVREFGHEFGVGRVAEAMGASAFPILTKTVVGNETIKSYQAEVGEVEELVSVAQSDSTSEDNVPGFTAVGGFEKREEGMRYEEKSFGEKKVSITVSSFGVILSFTKEALYEDRLGSLTSWARAAGAKGGQQRAKIIIQTLEMQPRTAFNESSSTLRAHVANKTVITQGNHYNSDHSAVTGLDGQVNDNVDATDNAEITTAGLEGCLVLFSDMLDEKGDEVVVSPKILVVPPKLKPSAWQLIGSPNQFDTGNNARNYFAGMYQLVSSTFLNTNYYYYLGDMKAQLLWLWTFRPQVQLQTASAEAAFTNDIIFQIRFDYHGGCGHTNYVYIVRGGAA